MLEHLFLTAILLENELEITWGKKTASEPGTDKI
jgi:hypothetical protein